MNTENYEYEKDNLRYDMSKNSEMNDENLYDHPGMVMATSFQGDKYKEFNSLENNNLMNNEKPQLPGCLIYKSIFRNKDNNFTPLNKFVKNNNNVNNNYINISHSQNKKIMSNTPNKNNNSYNNKNYLGKDANNRNSDFHNTINDYNYLKNASVNGTNCKPSTQNINIIKIDDKITNMDLSSNHLAKTDNINNNIKENDINYLPELFNLPNSVENKKVLNNLNFSNNNGNDINEILVSGGDKNIKRGYDKQSLLYKCNKSIGHYNSKKNSSLQYKKNKSAKGNLKITSTEKNLLSKNNASVFKNPELLDLYPNDNNEKLIEDEFADLDKNYFLQNAKEIQDLDFIDDEVMTDEINDVYNRSNIADLNNNISNIVNNSKDLMENTNSFEQNHKNNNSSNNVLEHCSFTARENNIVNNNAKIKSTNMNIISRGNKIIDKKIQNYSSNNNSNFLNRRDYNNNNSKNKNNFQNNYKQNKSFKNNNKNLIKNSYLSNKNNNEYINIINAQKENIENKKNSNKNLPIEKQQSNNYSMINNSNNYSTLSNDKKLKNLTGYNKLGNNIGPQNSKINNISTNNISNQSDFLFGQSKYSLNSTNYIDDSNNNMNVSNGENLNDYNLVNNYLKLKKINEKLQEELKYKNNCIKELKIKNKEIYDKLNNFVYLKKQLIEEAKKNEEKYKNKIKSLQNEYFLLKKENWELKNLDGGSNSYQKKIKQLQEEIGKYKKENNNLKIIIIQNKNKTIYSNNNDGKKRLSSSFNGAHNFDDESEERTRNRFYSSNHDINERRSGIKSNSVSKSRKKSIRTNKSFKEDLDDNRNIFKKNFIEEERSNKNENMINF